MSLFNEILGAHLRKVRKISPAREKALRARWKSSKERQNIEWWKEYWEIVAHSSFLLGRNHRDWQADFEWLLKENNLVKVAEGKYLDKKPGESLSSMSEYEENPFVREGIVV